MDILEHILVAGVVAALFAAIIHWVPFPLNAALCAGIAMFLAEFKESQAKLWYRPFPIYGWGNLKLAFKRTFGFGLDTEASDTLKDWLVPLTFWSIVSTILIIVAQ